jgi:hypothetical protein
MVAVVDIYNMALSRLGTKSTVAATTENSVEAEQLSIHYANARDCVLAGYDWGFARRSLTLARRTETAPTGWSYLYSYPTNCARFRGIGNPLSFPVIPFKILSIEDSGGNDVKAIAINLTSAEGWFTKIITNTELFDPMFVNALAWELASRVALPITQKESIWQRCVQMATATIPMAAAVNGNEGTDSVNEFDPDFMREAGFTTVSTSESY